MSVVVPSGYRDVTEQMLAMAGADSAAIVLGAASSKAVDSFTPNVVVTGVAGGTSLSVDQGMAQLRSLWSDQGVATSDVPAVRVDGISVPGLMLKRTEQGTAITQWQYLAVGSGRAYVLTFSASTKGASGFSPDVAAMMSSLDLG